MDVLTLLKEDHDRVRELFRRYKGGGGLTGLVKRVTGSVEAREQRDALKKVCDELEVHARVEEEIFYPAVRATGDAELNQQVDEGVREHGTVKRQIAAIRPRLGDAPNLSDEASALESCVEHHATEEENEMFPRVEQLLPEARRAELAREIRARKKALGGKPGAARRPARAATRATARTKTATRARGRRGKGVATKKATRAKRAQRARVKSRKRAS